MPRIESPTDPFLLYLHVNQLPEARGAKARWDETVAFIERFGVKARMYYNHMTAHAWRGSQRLSSGFHEYLGEIRRLVDVMGAPSSIVLGSREWTDYFTRPEYHPQSLLYSIFPSQREALRFRFKDQSGTTDLFMSQLMSQLAVYFHMPISQIPASDVAQAYDDLLAPPSGEYSLFTQTGWFGWGSRMYGASFPRTLYGALSANLYALQYGDRATPMRVPYEEIRFAAELAQAKNLPYGRYPMKDGVTFYSGAQVGGPHSQNPMVRLALAAQKMLTVMEMQGVSTQYFHRSSFPEDAIRHLYDAVGDHLHASSSYLQDVTEQWKRRHVPQSSGDRQLRASDPIWDVLALYEMVSKNVQPPRTEIPPLASVKEIADDPTTLASTQEPAAMPLRAPRARRRLNGSAAAGRFLSMRQAPTAFRAALAR